MLPSDCLAGNWEKAAEPPAKRRKIEISAVTSVTLDMMTSWPGLDDIVKPPVHADPVNDKPPTMYQDYQPMLPLTSAPPPPQHTDTMDRTPSTNFVEVKTVKSDGMLNVDFRDQEEESDDIEAIAQALSCSDWRPADMQRRRLIDSFDHQSISRNGDKPNMDQETSRRRSVGSSVHSQADRLPGQDSSRSCCPLTETTSALERSTTRRETTQVADSREPFPTITFDKEPFSWRSRRLTASEVEPENWFSPHGRNQTLTPAPSSCFRKKIQNV